MPLFMLCAIVVLAVTAAGQQLEGEAAACLLDSQLYHPSSRACQTVLASAPCPPQQWILPAPQPGLARCGPHLSCPPGRPATLTRLGEVECGCQPGSVARDNACHKLFTQADCGPGYVLIPANFQPGNLSCPGEFSCQRTEDCPAYSIMVEGREVEEKGSEIGELQRGLLKQLVCSREPRAICCPGNSLSLLSPTNLLQSLRPSLPECRPLPCPTGKWPWRPEAGPDLCLAADTEQVAGCMEDGELVVGGEGDSTQERLRCDYFALFSVAFTKSKKCRRPRVFIKETNRCQMTFG